MGSKKKKSRAKRPRTPEKKNKKNIFLFAGLIIAVVAVLAAAGNFTGGGDAGIENKGKSFTVHGEETLPVLDPAQFTGQARKAYEAARKYPEVLNQVFCYCFCDAEPFNHKSLLSCFTDKHGAG
jgi:hypothetical protein